MEHKNSILANTLEGMGAVAEAKVTAFDHTIEMMRSPNYKERFKAEYHQTKIRYEKLKAFNNKIEAARCTEFNHNGVKALMPKHDCPEDLLKQQQFAMGEYLHILEVRAEIENIDL